MLTAQPKKKRTANRKKHLQIKKTLSSIWQHTCCKCSQHNQKRNALQKNLIWLCCEHLQCVSLFVCVVSICTIYCQNYENVFFICWCFFYLHVFSEVAARWALSATVPNTFWINLNWFVLVCVSSLYSIHISPSVSYCKCFWNITHLFQRKLWCFNNQTSQNISFCIVHYGARPFCDPRVWSMAVSHYLNGVMWLSDRVTPSMGKMAPGQSMARS